MNSAEPSRLFWIFPCSPLPSHSQRLHFLAVPGYSMLSCPECLVSQVYSLMKRLILRCTDIPWKPQLKDRLQPVIVPNRVRYLQMRSARQRGRKNRVRSMLTRFHDLRANLCQHCHLVRELVNRLTLIQSMLPSALWSWHSLSRNKISSSRKSLYISSTLRLISTLTSRWFSRHPHMCRSG